MSLLALPTRKDEAWRYSDLKALANAHARPKRADIRDMLKLASGTTEFACTVDGDALHRPAQIIVPDGVTATLVERWGGSGWLNRTADIHIGAGATLHHIILQQRDTNSETTAEINVTGRYRGFFLNIGSHFGRISLTADASDTQLYAVQLGRGDQTLEIITRFDHAHADTTSQQLVRTVMAERATGSYLGKIYVAKNAQRTDAQQSSKALLLHRTAEVNTKPELEIHADDVKCAHGATVGELDKQALFYCQTRGITLGEARALLTEAFVADALDGISDDTLRAEIEAITLQWLQQAVHHA
jgi:Fe-S cluster assembly protein SufD